MSKRGGTSKGGGAKALNKEKSTPSGYTYEEFMSKSTVERVSIIENILKDDTIQVPSYIDGSDTSKVLYALGMNGKPQVLDDSTFDNLPGKTLYRTVNGNKYLTNKEILDQISYGDYTRLSDSGGSVYGRGIYFADKLGESLSYGYGGSTGVMRIKSAGAKFATDSKIPLYGVGKSWTDDIALSAIIRGYDGYYNKSSGYYVVLNRSKIAVSKTYKSKSWKKDNNKSFYDAKWDKLNDLT